MYRWVEHTSELELEVEGASEAEVFQNALAAFRELTAGGAAAQSAAGGGEGAAGDPVSREIALRAADRATLFAEWLAELAFLAETEELVPAGLSSLELGDGGLRATVEAHRGKPPHLVKAVTYHRLTFEQTDRRWRATAVLDV